MGPARRAGPLKSGRADARLSNRARAQIDRSIGPVWEANHVWLIFVLVVAWTAFSPAFSAVMTTLYIPLALAALGIVLRGSGFAFRHALTGPVHAPATRVFGISSVLTPFFLGTVAGAVASGEVPADGGGDPTSSWTGALPLLTGVLFVAICAYVAAVFLVRDAGAAGDEDLQRYFARRACDGGGRRGGRARRDLRPPRRRPVRLRRAHQRGPPLVILSGIAGLAALGLLSAGCERLRRPAQPAAFGPPRSAPWSR